MRENKTVKITRTVIAEAAAKLAGGNEGRALLWDSELPGFGARLTRKGCAYFFDYRGERNTRRRMTVGTADSMTPEAARRQAMALKVEVRQGADPLQEKRAAAKATAKLTVEAIAKRWLADGASRWTDRTARDYRYTLNCHILPAIGTEEAASLSKADISDMVAKVRADSPAAAAKVMRTISAMLRWAEDLELLEEAKLPRVKRTAPPVPPRERVLSDAEIRKVWPAADQLAPPDAAFVRLVILTVIRSSNASAAQASWLKGDTLHLPASVMKNAKAHAVPVPAWAADMIAPRLAGGGRMANPLLRDIRKLTGIKDMQWHDLRRSFSTWCAKSGIPETHAEEALAHISHRTILSKVYNKHTYEAEARKALEGWQAHVRGIAA